MVGMPQEYVVPKGTEEPVGVKLNDTAEQEVSAAIFKLATGNTVTVMVNTEEVHPPGTFGVTK
jgi:hypothetical protein